MIHGEPEPRNDLGVSVNPELFATILSPESVREIMEPAAGEPIPWTDAPPTQEAEIERWHNIWRKAMERGLGIAYHVG